MAAEVITDQNVDAAMEIADAIMTEGYTHQDFTGVTDEEMEAGYATAYNLLNQSQFKKAEAMFQLLCHLNHYEAKYWLGLGASRQQQKKYDLAVKAYALAGVHDAGNPIPSLRAAECYIALGQLTEAGQALAATKSWCGGKPEFEQINARADLLLESVQKKKEN